MFADKDQSQEDGRSSSEESEHPSDSEPPDHNQSHSQADQTPKVEQGPSGIKVEGNWQQVAETCSDVAARLEETCRSKSSEEKQLREWKDWYPREEEGQEDLGEKTAKQAKLEVEESPEDHFEQSADKLTSFRRKLSEGELEDSLKNLKDVSREWLVGVSAFLGKSAAKLEEMIYRNIVVKTNPFYFDNSLISASFRQAGRSRNNGESKYKLTVKVHDSELQDDVQRIIVSKS